MVVFVIMRMMVNDITMDMYVRVLTTAAGLLEPPGKIDEAKRDQRPARQIAAHTLDLDERGQLCACDDANQAEQNRTHHVANAAVQRDAQCFGQSPSASSPHCREHEVVVRTQHCVHNRHGRCGRQQDLRFIH